MLKQSQKMAADETLPEAVLAEYEKYALGADDVSHAFSSVKDVVNVFLCDKCEVFPILSQLYSDC